jgi:shikimate kinase
VTGRSDSIVLIGMMGAGKSSVGRCLQRRTGLTLLETDEIVASKFGMSIPAIFARHGERKFREAETESIRELKASTHAIIVTGGGIVLRKENLKLLKELGVVVWLHGNEDTLFERASRAGTRPLLRTENPRKAFSQMLQARIPLYAKLAKIVIDTSVLTDKEVAEAILSKLKKVGRNRRRKPWTRTTR